MKGSSNIVSSVHHLKMAYDHLESFCLEHPGTKGSRLFETYKKRLEWIVKDLVTHTELPESVREGIKHEWNSDVFAVPAIAEKSSLLNPEQREFIETVIDGLLNGEKITVEHGV